MRLQGKVKDINKGISVLYAEQKSKEGRESLVKREQFLNKDVNRFLSTTNSLSKIKYLF